MTEYEQDLQDWCNQATAAIHELNRRLAEAEWELENVKARLAEWEAGPH
jgi:hypothetical protein